MYRTGPPHQVGASSALLDVADKFWRTAPLIEMLLHYLRDVEREMEPACCSINGISRIWAGTALPDRLVPNSGERAVIIVPPIPVALFISVC